MSRALLCGIAVASFLAGAAPHAALTIETLRSTGGLPPHIAGLFEEPLAFQQTPGGPYYVFDRRGHSVYAVDSEKSGAFKLVEIGPEPGRIIQPRGFDTSATGSFVVADAPRTVDRVQVFGGVFGGGGLRTGGFTLPARQHSTAIEFGSLVMGGIGAIRYSGTNLLISPPESGALFTEYSPGGYAQRSVGRLRATGHEADRDVHLALNVGLPLHPAVRAAGVDPRGRLWVSLVEPYTYVYDPQGDKIRTIQFRAAGLISPTSLFFTTDGRLLVTPGCYEFRP